MSFAAVLSGALLLAAPAAASCASGVPWIQPRDAAVPVSSFSYATTTGALNWHNLAPANFLCGNGTNASQSPILLNTTSARAPAGSVRLDVPPARTAELENLGTTVELVINGSVTAAGRRWNLAQCHFHTPSEHLVANRHYDAEMHCVSTAADGSRNIAVLAFFVEADAIASTPLLEHVLAQLGAVQTPGTSAEVHNVDFGAFQRAANAQRFYHYSGSLTTPPCSEGVLWFVATAPIPLRVGTYHRLKDTTKTNNRYTQNTLGERNILQVAAAGL